MIHWFKDVGSDHLALVGGKGANLGECATAGFPVPPGFIIDTSAYTTATKAIQGELIAAVDKQDIEQAQQLVRSVTIPADLRAEVEQAYATLGDGARVAVRSSATAEDLAEASFAGQQDSYLGITGVDALWDAVRRCWASLWNERAVSYRRKHGVPSEGLALAVVVQTMISSDVSGVLFTRNPMADNTDMMISAAYGLGESVVAALVTPDTFTVTREPVTVVSQTIGSKETRIDMADGAETITTPVPPGDQALPCLDEQAIQQLVALGQLVEEHYDAPQDIEWAFADGELYLLQARPITTVASTDAASVEGHSPVRSRVERTLRNDLMEHYPTPYPLDLVAVHALQESIQDSMRMIGLKAPSAHEIIVGDDDGVIRIHAQAPRPDVAVVSRLPRTFVKGMRHDPTRWPAEERAAGEVLSQLARRAGACRDASDTEVVVLLEQILAQAAQLMSDRFLYYLAPMTVLRSKAKALIRLARQSDHVSTEDLYEDLDYVTANVLAGIRDLTATAQASGLVDVFTETPPEQIEDALQSAPDSARFLAEVDAFLQRRGARTACMYVPFSHTSWRETPQSLYELIAVSLRGQQASGSEVTGSAVAGSAVATVEKHLPRLLRGSWRTTVEKLRASHVGREGTLYAIEEVLVLARTAMRELARRLVDRGVLETTDDIRYLYFSEVTDALRDGVSRGEVVEHRRRQRGTAEAVWWDRGESTSDADAITGVPGSPGQVVGTARIIRTPADFGRLQPGDILVCPFTDPTWTPLFDVASAVVANIGGPLSHAAIVAREYGIPAVLGTGDATSRIKDGEKIIVDGRKGSVVVVR